MSLITEIDHSASTLAAIKYLDKNRAGRDDAIKKMLWHLAIIAVGAGIGVALSYVPGLGWFTIPLAQVPNGFVEIVDMIHRW